MTFCAEQFVRVVEIDAGLRIALVVCPATVVTDDTATDDNSIAVVNQYRVAPSGSVPPVVLHRDVGGIVEIVGADGGIWCSFLPHSPHEFVTEKL